MIDATPDMTHTQRQEPGLLPFCLISFQGCVADAEQGEMDKQLRGASAGPALDGNGRSLSTGGERPPLFILMGRLTGPVSSMPTS